MKKNILLLLLMFGFLAIANAQSITGKWKTIDDETGDPKSIVEIYEQSGKIYGKIVQLYRKPGEDPDPICDKCPKEDERFGKKVIGMEIIRDMKKSGSEYSGGTVLKPDEGKIYRCKIWLEDDKLMVRGYWGFLYRTQTWLRPD
ncbi:MAG TPA: DUF2147 domain-containing protein [Cyclobacteriaceae bacterium]|nr:DUF2147 domain-containing protein [Cyclobacteriaceae bacterium]